MMKKKISLSVLIAISLLLFVTGVVIAGTVLDMGTVTPSPPIGELNFFAWQKKNEVNGIPTQILTADNFASDEGQGGYQTIGDVRTWLLQVENFDNDDTGDTVKMIFGGLGNSSGNLWTYGFTWDVTVDLTIHTVGNPTSEETCPVIYGIEIAGSDKTVSFWHLPNSTYHVYRATQPSGAGNQLSSGRYNYLRTEITNEFGISTFTDVYSGDSWYVVIRADSDTNELVGCHSEELDPTNVRVLGFTATYLAPARAVELTWTSASEINIFGFNIYRSTNPEVRPNVPLNTKLIQAENLGKLDGNPYTFRDPDVQLGKTYYYWLEVVPLEGRDEIVGFASARTMLEFFFPLLHK